MNVNIYDTIRSSNTRDTNSSAALALNQHCVRENINQKTSVISFVASVCTYSFVLEFFLIYIYNKRVITCNRLVVEISVSTISFVQLYFSDFFLFFTCTSVDQWRGKKLIKDPKIVENRRVGISSSFLRLRNFVNVGKIMYGDDG